MEMKTCPNCNGSRFGPPDPWNTTRPCTLCIGTGRVIAKPHDTFFIERNIGDDAWSRYAGPFDTYDRAERYLKELCGWTGHRIALYERTAVCVTLETYTK